MIKTLLKLLLGGKSKSNVNRFLDGEIDFVTARDIDPEGSQLYDNYCLAMKHKERGELNKAASLLEQSCIKPSIYKGHYRELFKIYRQWNKTDIKKGKFDIVSERVLKMIRYDDEMIECILKHWSNIQKRRLSKNYFDKDRNLKVTDVKVLLKASEALNNEDNIGIAKKRILNFEQKKAKR